MEQPFGDRWAGHHARMGADPPGNRQGFAPCAGLGENPWVSREPPGADQACSSRNGDTSDYRGAGPAAEAIAAPVKKVDTKIRQLMDDMLDTMYLAPGIGLAAPGWRAEASSSCSTPTRTRATASEDGQSGTGLGLGRRRHHYSEGCLSVPDHYADVQRPSGLPGEVSHENNEALEIPEVDGLLATCIQLRSTASRKASCSSTIHLAEAQHHPCASSLKAKKSGQGVPA